MLSVESQEIKSHQMDVETLIVLLRFSGKSSISNISEILKALNYQNNSEGMISQRLKKYGTILPSTLSSSKECPIIFLSDENFALGCPILITIDPNRPAILKIELAPNRTKERA